MSEKCYTLTESQIESLKAEARADALAEVEEAMYHQCFECDNDEELQKWEGGNWLRYKLFENVMEQLKERSE